jgi:hypothetical protein
VIRGDVLHKDKVKRKSRGYQAVVKVAFFVIGSLLNYFPIKFFGFLLFLIPRIPPAAAYLRGVFNDLIKSYEEISRQG